MNPNNILVYHIFNQSTILYYNYVCFQALDCQRYNMPHAPISWREDQSVGSGQKRVPCHALSPPPRTPPSNDLDGKVVKVGNRSIDPGGLVAVVHGAQQYLLRVLGEPDLVL